jgi:hypothetical protein
MSAAALVVFVSVAAAVACWAVGQAFNHRGAWLVGALLMLVHSAAAFATFYEGRHDVAQLATMHQTRALTGIEFAGGIFVNYLFLAVWMTDAAWWGFAPGSYRTRPRVVSYTIRGFIFFIIVNGAVVFADGWARVVGASAVILVVAAWSLKRSSRRDVITTAG